MMNREVRSIMYKKPKTLAPTENAADVSHYMLNNHVQHMVVVDENKVMGLVTSYDLWKQYEDSESVKDKTVKDVMDTNILKIAPKDKVGTAAELLASKRFSTLVVVNLRNELKGIVTSFDIVKNIFNDEYREPILFKKEFQMV